MKPPIFLALGLLLVSSGAMVRAQEVQAGATATLALNPDQLDELLGPIALYPDPLISLILPASTVPSDVVLAARYLNGNGDPAQVENQPWDDSVRALAHYPDVIKWMDENLTWTKQLGEAFLDEPSEVMTSVQRLRGRARAVGSLVDTPQQEVVVEDGAIEIVPAQPDVIYVPRYDPEIVYVERPVYYTEPYISFGVGFSVGSWLFYDLDWQRRSLWVSNRHDWHDRRDWRRPNFSGPRAPSDYHAWRPRPNQPHPLPPRARRGDFHPVAPRPIVGAPSRPANWPDRRHDEHGGDRRRTPGTSTRVEDRPQARPENRTGNRPQYQPAPRPENRPNVRPQENPRSEAAPSFPRPPAAQVNRNPGPPAITPADLPPTGPIPSRQGTPPAPTQPREMRNRGHSDAPRPAAPANQPVPERRAPNALPPQAQGRPHEMHPQRPQQGPQAHPVPPQHADRRPPPPPAEDRKRDDSKDKDR